MGNDMSNMNRATAVAAANALASEFGSPQLIIRPPPDGVPPERCVYQEPLPLVKDNTDARFGRARATYDHRIDAHAIRGNLLLGDASAAMDSASVHEHRITHVVNCLGARCSKFTARHSLAEPNEQQRAAYAAARQRIPTRLRYLSLDLVDTAEQNLLEVFPRACEWIEAQLSTCADTADDDADDTDGDDDGGGDVDHTSLSAAVTADPRHSAGSSSAAADLASNTDDAAKTPASHASNDAAVPQVAYRARSAAERARQKHERDQGVAGGSELRDEDIRVPLPFPVPPPPRASPPTSPTASTAAAASAASASHAGQARVLVHCMAGVSRSASVLIAYLMWREGLTAARALREVQLRRCIANPNPGFRVQLLRWERALQRERALLSLPPLRRVDESIVDTHPELKAITDLFS